jgi:hypothetical protein
MKAIFILVLYFSCIGSLMDAQTWMPLEQKPLNLRYEIPYNWYVGGYMTGRSCQCTSGTINTAPSRELNMVIFYSDEHSVDSLQKQDIWGYRFLNPSVTEQISTTHFEFEAATSRWENDSNVMVMRLSASKGDHSYVIYFWGPDHVVGNARETILHIINSISLLS